MAGERRLRDGELTEIKSVVDEMMTLDASASGGGVAGRHGDLFSPRGDLVVDRRDTTNSCAMMIGMGGSMAHVTGRSALSGSNSHTMIAGATAARLNEAWSLLEASEAARRRLQEEIKGWAERVAGLEEALAAAEAAAEEKGREARLLAASLQDVRDGLATEETARREAEGRAEALR